MSVAVQHHVVRTWHAYKAAAAPRLLCDSWPQVLPVPGGGIERTVDTRTSTPNDSVGAHPRLAHFERVEIQPQQRSSARAWLASLAAFDELRAYADFATLLRRGVELLREAIGLERAAIFLLHPGHRLTGTFGTGPNGETTDERHIAFEMGHSHREAFTLCDQGLAQWSRFSNVPLFAQSGDQTVTVRTGENVIVPIPGPGGCIGLIACDWGLTGAATDTDTLVRTAVFARIVSPLLTPWLTTLTETNLGATSSPAQQLVGASIRRLRVNPNEDRHAIAKALGTTADRLGRVFKAEMGETIPEYRNRLRLERFFAVVDAEGGNLLGAALDAGFGSYAQFHRVFHGAFNCSPIDYIKRNAI